MLHRAADPLDTIAVTRKKTRFGGYRTPDRILPSDQSTPRDQARLTFLDRVAVLAPDVLNTLSAVDGCGWMKDDPVVLRAWADHWHLAPWVLAYASETLRLWRAGPQWRGRIWSRNPSDVAGVLMPSTGRQANRPTAIVVPYRHFDWLVQRRVLQRPIEDVSIDDTGEAVDSGTVRRALRSLTIILDGKTPTKSRS